MLATRQRRDVGMWRRVSPSRSHADEVAGWKSKQRVVGARRHVVRRPAACSVFRVQEKVAVAVSYRNDPLFIRSNAMRDNQEIMLKFVALVEKFPEVYDSSKTYRTRFDSEKTWEKIAACVRAETNEECTAEELKIKWKGIRSSFARFKKKLLDGSFELNSRRKYYLYDSLMYLDKFIEPRVTASDCTIPQPVLIDDGNNSLEMASNIEEWDEHDVKPDISYLITKQANENDSSDSDKDTYYKPTKATKRKNDDRETMKRDTDNNEDMQFFKSILPDLNNFTSKEKRKFKMSILKLIDEIEDDRKQLKTNNNEVSSS